MACPLTFQPFQKLNISSRIEFPGFLWDFFKAQVIKFLTTTHSPGNLNYQHPITCTHECRNAAPRRSITKLRHCTFCVHSVQPGWLSLCQGLCVIPKVQTVVDLMVVFALSEERVPTRVDGLVPRGALVYLSFKQPV
jgi:hypothetical protein